MARTAIKSKPATKATRKVVTTSRRAAPEPAPKKAQKKDTNGAKFTPEELATRERYLVNRSDILAASRDKYQNDPEARQKVRDRVNAWRIRNTDPKTGKVIPQYMRKGAAAEGGKAPKFSPLPRLNENQRVEENVKPKKRGAKVEAKPAKATRKVVKAERKPAKATKPVRSAKAAKVIAKPSRKVGAKPAKAGKPGRRPMGM